MKFISSTFRVLLVALGAAAAMMTIGTAARAQDTTTWRLGHTLSVPGTLYEQILTKELPERIAKATGGAVRVQPIIGIVKTPDVISALQQGRVEMGDVSVAYIAATHPSWAVMSLPGLVEDERLVAPIADKIVLPAIAQDLKQMGIRPVVSVAWVGGAYFTNKRIDKVADIKGTKWRTHAPMLSKTVAELGGAPIGMPFEELYPSLERGLVDAYTTTFPAMYATGLQKVTKHAILAPQGTTISVVMVGEQALAKLPADLRSKVLAELSAINRDAADRLLKERDDVIAKLKSAGVEMITLAPEENAKFVAAAKTAVWAAWRKDAGEAGEKLLQQIENYKP